MEPRITGKKKSVQETTTKEQNQEVMEENPAFPGEKALKIPLFTIPYVHY